MNDRLNQKVIAAVTQSSPSCLLRALGLGEVLVIRPGRLPEKNGVVRLDELDQDIQNRGRCWVFRRATEEDWAHIHLFNHWNSYRCHWVEFDYTKGKFYFGMTQIGTTRNSCTPFLMAVHDLPKVRLLPIRRCDIV